MKHPWAWAAALGGALLLVAGCQNPHVQTTPTPAPIPTDYQLPTLPEGD